jgi:uncharacterized protein YcfJ
MKTALALLLAITPVAAADQYQSAFDNQYEQQSGYSKSRTCYRSEYREEYIPGTEDDPGYVRSWKETIEVPCNDDTAKGRVIRETVVEYDDNDCSEGTVAGGLLGGGLAAFGTRGKDRWWTIPTGIIGGAMVGCQIDGG